jgi:hypothetical protein
MPLLSVVVPTHNRSDYALACIKAVLALDSADLELVMTDTSTDNRLRDCLQGPDRALLADPRFVYRKLEGPSSLTKNHNDAMALATGEYVCIIGDDDCVTEAALDAARWAAVHDVPAVSQTVRATFAWPDFRSQLARRGHAGRLYVPRGVGEARWRTGSSDLQEALARACQATDGMPRCYHGIVRRDLLETVRERSGAYFHGSSPDMSGAVAVACLIDTYCEVDLPLTIPGVSGGSNSGRSAMNSHKGELSSETQTAGFQDAGWTLGVPRFFAVETVWAHAGLETLKLMRPQAVQHFAYARLNALCRVRHPEFVKACDHAQEEASELVGRDLDEEVAAEVRRARWERRRYLLRRAMIPTAANGRRYFSQLATIAEASQRYRSYVCEQGLSLVNAMARLEKQVR